MVWNICNIKCYFGKSKGPGAHIVIFLFISNFILYILDIISIHQSVWRPIRRHHNQDDQIFCVPNQSDSSTTFHDNGFLIFELAHVKFWRILAIFLEVTAILKKIKFWLLTAWGRKKRGKKDFVQNIEMGGWS